ncbi:MAG: hypothetical protein MI864_04400, partial [Pseudomonadales bacterium]|nr:hypothetical protein [Pseudomonadales bacterium]
MATQRSKWILSFAVFLLAACSGSNQDPPRKDDIPLPDTDLCSQNTGEEPNWNALQMADCPNLDNYNLFQNLSDPTAVPNNPGLRFDLATPLFSDYSVKYRFLWIPKGRKARYSEREVIEFPVGTVLAKTFTLPNDTAIPGIENERLIETRLLIHRPSGWVALPYRWNNSQSRAQLALAGGTIQVSLIHNGQQLDFNYVMPDRNQCKICHQWDSGNRIELTPLGPKARNLNLSINDDSHPGNQLL